MRVPEELHRLLKGNDSSCFDSDGVLSVEVNTGKKGKIDQRAGQRVLGGKLQNCLANHHRMTDSQAEGGGFNT